MRLLWALLILTLGCPSPSPKPAKQRVRAVTATTCTYGSTDACENGICLQFEENESRCFSYDQVPSLLIPLPYDRGLPTICDQGVLSPLGNSHTWQTTAFAVDLNNRMQSDPPTVLAVRDGTVIVFDGCTEQNDDCGARFGNHVKLLSDDGFLFFYAHLQSVAVKSGDRVTAGTTLGIQGGTGWTGENNPHLHFSVHYDWRDQPIAYWNKKGFLPRSVPFQFSLCIDGCGPTCKRSPTSVTDLPCRRDNISVSPICS